MTCDNNDFTKLDRKKLAFNLRHGYKENLYMIFVTANQTLVFLLCVCNNLFLLV